MTASIAPGPTNFHMSLNAADLKRSVEFFSKLFGCAPAKFRDDYAKFEVSNPPLTLSLEPVAPTGTGALNHAGFRLANTEELVALQRRLEMAGLASQREEGVECCYSRQTKFWLHDPDGNLWEFYVLEKDIEHRGAGQADETVRGEPAHYPDLMTIRCDRQSADATWSHRLGQPFPIPLAFADASLQSVKLEGTLNGEVDVKTAGKMLAEIARVLKPGGRLSIHNLTADRHLAGKLQLPGPAVVVKRVPVDVELLDLLVDRGFMGVRLLKFGSAPCFQLDGVEMRETMLEAFRSPDSQHDATVTVVYKGPFREVALDSGSVLRRGQRSEMPAAEWEILQTGPLGDECVALKRSESPVVCTS